MPMISSNTMIATDKHNTNKQQNMEKEKINKISHFHVTAVETITEEDLLEFYENLPFVAKALEAMTGKAASKFEEHFRANAPIPGKTPRDRLDVIFDLPEKDCEGNDWYELENNCEEFESITTAKCKEIESILQDAPWATQENALDEHGNIKNSNTASSIDYVDQDSSQCIQSENFISAAELHCMHKKYDARNSLYSKMPEPDLTETTYSDVSISDDDSIF